MSISDTPQRRKRAAFKEDARVRLAALKDPAGSHDDKPSLLSTRRNDCTPPSPDPRILEARRRLDEALKKFTASSEHRVDEFGRYCLQVTRILDRTGMNDRTRQSWIGAYIEAASKKKRAGGRRQSTEVPLLNFLRHEINLRQRGAKTLEESLSMSIPAAKIAAWAARDWGVNLTPEQVRKRIGHK